MRSVRRRLGARAENPPRMVAGPGPVLEAKDLQCRKEAKHESLLNVPEVKTNASFLSA